MYKGQKVKVRTQTEKKIHDKCAHKTRTKTKNQLKTMCVVFVFHVYLCVCPNVCCAWTVCGAGMLCVWWVDLVVVGALPKSKCDCLYVWLLLLQFRRFSACFTFVGCPHSKSSINRIQRLSPSPVSLSSFSSQPLSFPFITLAMLFVEPVIPCCCWLRALGTAADAAAGATVRRLLLTACC